jgi:hypothetical protein
MEDSLVKGSILKAIYNNESLTEADVKQDDWTYKKLLDTLGPLIKEHPLLEVL